jgi:hypothetical protein
VSDHHSRSVRLRYTATGALAALAAVGAIAGPSVLAAAPRAKPRSPASVANCSPAKTPSAPLAGSARTAQPGSSQPFLADAQRLVDDGTLSATEGQVLERDIQAGTIDTATLASSGFTPSQLAAVQQALVSTKRALAAAAPRAQK